jgi:hypothetical protein
VARDSFWDYIRSAEVISPKAGVAPPFEWGPTMTQAEHPTLQRLDDQIAWYDAASGRAQRWYKRLTTAKLFAAALIPLPVVLGIPNSEKVATVLALAILMMEQLQWLNQYARNWIDYRATCEALKHESYLFRASGGRYENVEQPISVLAARIENLASQDKSKWPFAEPSAGKSNEKNVRQST